MLDHVTIRVSDLDAPRRFYTTALGTGHRASMDGPPIDHLWLGVADLARSRRFYETIAPSLGLTVADADPPGLVSVARGNRHLMLVADGRPPTGNLHLAFPVDGDDRGAAFHRAATDHPGYVGAFVLGPDGTNVEAVNHNR